MQPKKSDTVFSESATRFYLELWATRQQRVFDELQIFRRQAENDRILATLTSRVEAGLISRDEIIRLLSHISSNRQERAAPKPLIVSLSISIDEATLPPKLKSAPYVKIADYLEKQLIRSLRNQLMRPIIQTEASARDGESLGVRIALWDVDVERLHAQKINAWELLGLDNYDDIYKNDVSHLFKEALDRTFDIFDAEERGCPMCGGKVVITATALERGEFAIGTCESCGWENYSG